MRAMLAKLVSGWGAVALLLIAIMAMGGMSFAAVQAAQNSGAEQGIAGTWVGVLGGQLHLIVTITQSSDRALGGTLNSVDQHAVLALSSVTVEGSAVRFEVPRVGGVYEGKLSKDGSKMSGTWMQTGVPAQPLDFERRAEASGAPEESAAPSTAPPATAAQPPAAAQHTPKPIAPLLDMVVPTSPVAFKADGKWHLVYELHIANMDRWDYAFTRIDVLPGDASQKTLASFSGSELDGMFSHPGLPGAEKVAKLVPGEFGAVFMWVTFDKLEDVPAAITHRISVKIGDYPEAYSVVTLPTSVNKNPVVVISSPLTGSDWVAANGPSNTSPHRRALIPINGRAYISQRFAIDWVQLNPDGKTYTGDPSDNKNYRAYGAEIHAVADGVVTQTKDGLPQNPPGAKSLAVPLSLETIGGNHVIMEIGDGLYAFYAHMQPGSVRVKVGDKVRRGQVLGLLGNTGNSSEPHLHFQICDANSELGSEGLPYAFASFEVLGKGDTWKPGESHAAVKHEMEIPTEDEIVQFDGDGK
jgi:murein DD-endopeptidase MepM/ murein hydrolase activator NlpD/small nuclear ribonucleoprotein (snRNP)-like protein